MLKKKMISGHELEIETRKMIEDFMLMQADDEYD